MDTLLNAVTPLLDFGVLFYMVAGLAFGVICGAIPGLNAGIGIALMLPVTYGLDVLTSLVFLTSIYTGGVFGGAITAILINAPGSPSSVATTFDGHPMALKGQANEALGISLASSALGGLLGMVFLVVIIQPLASFALQFGPAETFLLVVFALTSIASLSEESFVKGLAAGLFGLLLGTIGLTASGSFRFTFGSIHLIDGIPIVPALIGFLALSELFLRLETGDAKLPEAGRLDFRRILNGMLLVPRRAIALVRSSVIGIFIGAIPGVGATVGSLISYEVGKRSSRRGRHFGEGEPDGIVTAEAANNASEGGAMATMLALGIPGGAATAILIGALTLQGIVPGPRLIFEHQDVVFGLLAAEMLEQILLIGVGFVVAALFLRVIYTPFSILVPVIVVMCFIGAFAVRNAAFDAGLLVAFGVIGWIMKREGYPVIAVVIGLMLGGTADAELIRTFQLYGDLSILYESPICLALIILTIASLSLPVITRIRRARGNRHSTETRP
ncbi:tripartite tricarboxylate transporter permease [Lutibaculum baratangense]|uniref:Tricarboxylate transport membrane protein TctA n=1 Tax=Lutibaculum baratangense AMV1 TaxID=631454 RepID=V4RN23_9HYPH|nr:tripartite tricarboxylate transporter permease [Lutibaculum baratangense]ESR27381.1 Tricarboxylate transport membrane protein TctA [Lutibaculum baratangense AMV1]